MGQRREKHDRGERDRAGAPINREQLRDDRAKPRQGHHEGERDR